LKKELKEQIKQDEFASGLERAFDWAQRHAEALRIGGGVALVVLAALGGLAYFQAQRAREADRAFRDALASFEASVGAAESSATPGATAAFPSREEKYKTAAAALEGVERRYGSAAVGGRAKYFAALSRLELKQYAEAERVLREVSSRGAGLEPELARFALADLARRKGETDKAVEAYRGLATNPSAGLPRDYALFCAAATLDDARRYGEARAAYRRLIEEFPASVFVGQARSRAEYLASAS
jgi:hypothetical protein